MHKAYLEEHLTFTNRHIKKTVCVVQDSKLRCNIKRVVLFEKGIIANKTSRSIFGQWTIWANEMAFNSYHPGYTTGSSKRRTQ